MDIAQLLAFGVKQGASDLHLSAGLPPMIRVDGDIRRINVPEMDHKQVHDMIYDIMSDKQRKDYEEFLETDFSFQIPGLARFRVNAFNHNRGSGGVFRTIPSKILSLEDLGAPKIFQEISEYPRGIVLVCRLAQFAGGQHWHLGYQPVRRPGAGYCSQRLPHQSAGHPNRGC